MLAFVSLSCQAASPLELARRAVQAGDTNGDGMLDVAEFEKQLVTSSELVGAVFDALDVDRDGQLDAEPFQALEKEEKREKREKERKEKKRAGWYEGVVYTMDGEQIEVSDQSGSGFWPKVEHALGTSLGLFIESGTFTDTETDEDYEVEYKDYIERCEATASPHDAPTHIPERAP